MLDNLAVSITSQVSDVKAGITSVRSSFVDLATTSQGTASRLDEAADQMDDVRNSSLGLIASTQILQGRLDEAADEARDLGLSAGVAAPLVSSLGFSSEGAAFGVTALSTSLTVALIPAVLTLATILAPLVATLGVLGAIAGGLAGAFGLVIGSGIIAGFNQLKSTAQETLGLLEAQLTGFGQAFIPLLNDFLKAIPQITREILNSVGDLDPFVSALREIGGIAAEALPGLAARLADLARDALPSLVGIIRTLAEDGPGAFNTLLESADRAIPVLEKIGAALIENGPALLEFGTNVLELAGPALVELINIGGDVLSFVNNLTPNIRNLAIGLAALAPVILGLVSLLGGPFTLAFIGVLALVAAWEDNFLGLRETILGVIDTIESNFSGFVEGIKDMIRGAIEGLNDFIRAANNLPGVDIGTIDPSVVGQTPTPQTGNMGGRQNQLEVRVTSDDDKFQAEVRDLSRQEIDVIDTQRSDRADRFIPR